MRFQNMLLEKHNAAYQLARVWKSLDDRCTAIVDSHGSYVLGLPLGDASRPYVAEFWACRDGQTLVAKHFNELQKSTCIVDILDEGTNESTERDAVA